MTRNRLAGILPILTLSSPAILREMVCRRTLTLAQAQHALETNWYAAWLRYVIAAGHI